MDTENNRPDIPVEPAEPAPVVNAPNGAQPDAQPPVGPYAGNAPVYPQPSVGPYGGNAPVYPQPSVGPYGGNAPVYPQPPVNPYAPPAAQPTPVYPQPRPVSVPSIPRRKSKPRDLIMAVVVGLALFCLTDCFIWTGRLGLGFACGALTVLAATLVYLRPYWRHKSVYSAACVALYTAACVSFVFSADSGPKIMTALSLPLLYACILMDGMELRAWQPGSFRSIVDCCYVYYGLGFGKFAHGLYGLFHVERGEGPKRGKGVGKALLGLVIALPFAAILVALLAGGDPAFKGMLDSIDLGKAPQRLLSLLLAIPLFIIVFCRLFVMQSIERKRREESGKGLDPTVLMFFMLGICVVYAAYLFSQLAYFFNGFMGFLPDGFTYAGYARKGFFELTAVSVINIILIILATALSRKKEGKLPPGIKLPSLFLCLFSLVLAATEIAKMKMYMDNFGLTLLRIYTTVFTVFLAAVFIALIIHLFARRFPYFKVAVVIGAALIITTSFVSADRLVAEYNVSAYKSGVLESVDVRTITWLGDAAVPSLLELAQDSDSEVANEAKENLYLRYKRLHNRGISDSYYIGQLMDYDYRGFNTVSYQARQLLLDNSKDYIKFVHFDK